MHALTELKIECLGSFNIMLCKNKQNSTAQNLSLLITNLYTKLLTTLMN